MLHPKAVVAWEGCLVCCPCSVNFLFRVFFLSEMIRTHKPSSFYRLKEEGFQGRVAQSRSAAAADCKAKASPVCGLIVKTTALCKLPTCSFSPRSFWGKSSFLKGIPANANGTSQRRPSPSLPFVGFAGWFIQPVQIPAPRHDAHTHRCIGVGFGNEILIYMHF